MSIRANIVLKEPARPGLTSRRPGDSRPVVLKGSPVLIELGDGHVGGSRERAPETGALSC